MRKTNKNSCWRWRLRIIPADELCETISFRPKQNVASFRLSLGIIAMNRFLNRRLKGRSFTKETVVIITVLKAA